MSSVIDLPKKKSILDFVHHFNVNLLLQDKSRLLFMSVAKIHTVCFTFRCIFSRHIGSIIPCIFWYAYLILKLLSWSHLVPKSIWNPPIINSIRRNPTTSGCYLYNINLPIPVAKKCTSRRNELYIRRLEKGELNTIELVKTKDIVSIHPVSRIASISTIVDVFDH